MKVLVVLIVAVAAVCGQQEDNALPGNEISELAYTMDLG